MSRTVSIYSRDDLNRTARRDACCPICLGKVKTGSWALSLVNSKKGTSNAQLRILVDCETHGPHVCLIAI